MIWIDRNLHEVTDEGLLITDYGYMPEVYSTEEWENQYSLPAAAFRND
jgi:hypothetical protein